MYLWCGNDVYLCEEEMRFIFAKRSGWIFV